MLKLKDRYDFFVEYFSLHQPEADTELDYTDPYELLVAVILSAQCTDKRVNMITPGFYERFPDAQSLSEATQPEVFELIRTCSYPNNKAKHLIGMAQMLIRDFKGIVPDDVDELQKLPGVGRKTANVIASVVYKKPAMAVDTHVFRVAARIGLTKNAKTPLETERQLVKHIPEDKIAVAHHWLILHGRYICQARKPLCGQCPVAPVCLYYEKHPL
ncbi:MAG: endonuclease III [Bacteroidota bacterium]